MGFLASRDPGIRLHVKLNFDENSANDRSNNYLGYISREFSWLCPIAELWCQKSRIRRDLGSYFRNFCSKPCFSSQRYSVLRILLPFSLILWLYLIYFVCISVFLLVGLIFFSGERNTTLYRVTVCIGPVVVSDVSILNTSWLYQSSIIRTYYLSYLCLPLHLLDTCVYVIGSVLFIDRRSECYDTPRDICVWIFFCDVNDLTIDRGQ